MEGDGSAADGLLEKWRAEEMDPLASQNRVGVCLVEVDPDRVPKSGCAPESLGKPLGRFLFPSDEGQLHKSRFAADKKLSVAEAPRGTSFVVGFDPEPLHFFLDMRQSEVDGGVMGQAVWDFDQIVAVFPKEAERPGSPLIFSDRKPRPHAPPRSVFQDEGNRLFKKSFHPLPNGGLFRIQGVRAAAAMAEMDARFHTPIIAHGNA